MRTAQKILCLLAVLVPGLSCDGAAGDVCMEACDRVGECSDLGGTVMGCTFTEQECSGFNKCAAGCVVAAPCEELRMSPDAEGYEDTGYAQCARVCLFGREG